MSATAPSETDGRLHYVHLQSHGLESFQVMLCQFDRKGRLYFIGLMSSGVDEDGEELQGGPDFYKCEALTSWLQENDMPERTYFITMHSTLLLLALMSKYAKVETLESKARTKIHAHGCKYLNETDLDLTYLDSKWFTTLVNSKGFKVGGHFRLQPKKKDGEWTKELIWIADFEKKGYNRKAGILK